ncbi:hypothetical protein DRQ33_05730 [bacterium]|nr:MAG: hypothetical protein DRQ33_05730 [bacterium]
MIAVWSIVKYSELGDTTRLDGAFTMSEIDSPLREVVMVWFRSEYGKMLLERPYTGGQYPTITDKDMENVLIPNLPETGNRKNLIESPGVSFCSCGGETFSRRRQTQSRVDDV